MSKKPSVIFMGTPEFAKTILQKLHAEGFPILAVFAQPDKPVGRGQKLASPPVAEFAKEHHLPLFQPEKIKDADVFKTLQSFSADFLIVAAYGKILPQEILNSPKIDCINVHGSLLPEYRGAAPVQRAILEGKSQTGVAIMSMVYELDAGPVYTLATLPIDKTDNSLTLMQKLAELGANELASALPKIAKGELNALEQDESRVTYAHKLAKDMAHVDWQKSAQDIAHQIQALNPWPVAETTVQGKRLRLYEACALDSQTKAKPGSLVHMATQGLTVATGDGDLLLITCQAEGKKRMPAFEVANGLRLQLGDCFI